MICLGEEKGGIRYQESFGDDSTVTFLVTGDDDPHLAFVKQFITLLPRIIVWLAQDGSGCWYEYRNEPLYVYPHEYWVERGAFTKTPLIFTEVTIDPSERLYKL